MSVEVSLHWRDGDVAFVDRMVCREPCATEARAIAPGELVPAWDADRVLEVPRAEMALRRRYGPPIELQPGRFYPRRLAGSAVESVPGEGNAMQPMRVLAVNADAARLDLNAPWSRFGGDVSVQPVDAPAAFTGDPLRALLAGGVGMQAAPVEGAVHWLDADALRREDETVDTAFYARPRLVHHLDAHARARLAARHGAELAPGMRVLDLMSSWTSHLPSTLPAGVEVTGLGMNAEELAENPVLAARVTHDLNADAHLPFADATFARVFCTVSIEYLSDPVAVLSEVARVLAPGGRVVIAFSDRWFPTKAIKLWGDLHPFQRPGLVLHCLRETGRFTGFAAESIQGLARPADDKYASQRTTSDPLFVVTATRTEDD